MRFYYEKNFQIKSFEGLKRWLRDEELIWLLQKSRFLEPVLSGLQPSVTLAPGSLVPSSGLYGHQHSHRHIIFKF